MASCCPGVKFATPCYPIATGLQSHFSKCIDLSSNVLYSISLMNYLNANSFCRCWLYYITIRLNFHVSIFKIWVRFTGSDSLSNIAPRAPFVKTFRNHSHLRCLFIPTEYLVLLSPAVACLMQAFMNFHYCCYKTT